MGDQKHSLNLREGQRVPQSWAEPDVPAYPLPTQPTRDAWADVAVGVDPHGDSPCLDSGAKQKEGVLR